MSESNTACPSHPLQTLPRPPPHSLCLVSREQLSSYLKPHKRPALGWQLTEAQRIWDPGKAGKAFSLSLEAK